MNGGNLSLDLSTVDFHGRSPRTAVKLGVGQAEITVPQDVDVTVHGDLSAGDFRMAGYERNGQGLHIRHTDLGPDGKGGGTLDVQTDIGFGRLVVRRAAA
jgi:predicted membrane protein